MVSWAWAQAAWADADKSSTVGARPPSASVVNGVSSSALIRTLNRSTAGIATGAGRYERCPCVLSGQAIRNRARKPVPRGSAPARSMNPRSASGWTMTPKVSRRSRNWNDDLLRRSTAISPPSYSTLSLQNAANRRESLQVGVSEGYFRSRLITQKELLRSQQNRLQTRANACDQPLLDASCCRI
jgi:hypothetical protein